MTEREYEIAALNEIISQIDRCIDEFLAVIEVCIDETLAQIAKKAKEEGSPVAR